MKKDLDILEYKLPKFECPYSSRNEYVACVLRFYNTYCETSVIHVDSLVLIYKMTRDERTFATLFKIHKYLLDGIAGKTFHKYSSYLLNEDYNEIKCMLYEEFYRRVLFYEIPPRSPFSKYVKDYLGQWANVYVKLMARKRMKYTLDCERGIDVEFTHADSDGVV